MKLRKGSLSSEAYDSESAGDEGAKRTQDRCNQQGECQRVVATAQELWYAPLVCSLRVPLMLAAVVLFSPTTAFAFCLATSCQGDDCPRDDGGCVTGAPTLHWAQSCVGFTVQQSGSPLRGISYEAANGLAREAFAAWLSAECPGGRPAIALADLGPAECAIPSYAPDGPNANVVLFRDTDWPYSSSEATSNEWSLATEFARTRLRFDEETGEIWDADIEINTAQWDFGVTGGGEGYDLQSILTHEVGHLLGLDHSSDEGATMYSGYRPGDISPRRLSVDDMEAICALYPPKSDELSPSCEPKGGFSDKCADTLRASDSKHGCFLSGVRDGEPHSSVPWRFMASLLTATLLRGRRRKQ